MKNQKALCFAVILLFFSTIGCSIQNYTPVIDKYNTPNFSEHKFQSDLVECRKLAEQRLSASEGGAAGAVVGAALGAGLGLALGAIFGIDNLGDIVAADAVAGAVVGGASGGAGSAKNQRQIVSNCMRLRGYAVVGY